MAIVTASAMFSGCGENNNDNRQQAKMPAGALSKNLVAFAAMKSVSQNAQAQSHNTSYAAPEYNYKGDKDKADGVPFLSNEYLKVSYPFDFVKIINAKEFYLSQETENSILSDNYCGKGNLRVIIAEFETLRNSESGGQPIVDISDTIAVFMGGQGLYSCLMGGGGYLGQLENGEPDFNNFYCSFSSYKQLNDDTVSKDLTPPIFTFNFKINFQDGIDINMYEEIWYKEYGPEDIEHLTINLGSYAMISDSFREIEKETLYSVLELSTIPQIELNCFIEEIEKGEETQTGALRVFHQEEGLNLKKIVITDDTEICFSNGEKTENYGFIPGCNITIFYDNYYEEYNPVITYVNKVIINT